MPDIDKKDRLVTSVTDQEALDFHAMGRPGKLEINATKPMATQRDLSLAYSPGVAVPVKAIAADPQTAYDYTARGNMVAVISNGTAILGLGNLGALASKPVMTEGGEATEEIDAEQIERPGLAERLFREAPAARAFLVGVAGEDGIDLFPDLGRQRRPPQRLGLGADDAVGAVLLELFAVAAVDQVEVAGPERFEDDGHALRRTLAAACHQRTHDGGRQGSLARRLAGCRGPRGRLWRPACPIVPAAFTGRT